MKVIVFVEADWQDRRKQRIARYRKVIGGRASQAKKTGNRTKLFRTIDKVHASTAKWNKRGAKKGAGGSIKTAPMYKLISQKMSSKSEAYQRTNRLLKVQKILRAASAGYHGAKFADDARAKKLLGLRAAATLSRGLVKAKGKSTRSKRDKLTDKKFRTLIAKNKLETEE